MKKIIIASLAALLVGIGAQAQGIGSSRFGIGAGFTSSATAIKDFDVKNVSLYHVGVYYQIPLISGLSIQPGIHYQVKGATLDNMVGKGTWDAKVGSLETKVGYLEIPVQVQWGLDLMFLRPYVFAEPFIGLGLNIDSSTKENLTGLTLDQVKDFGQATAKRIEYGLGVGVGLEIWRFQLAAKYYWNFGRFADETTGEQKLEAMGNTIQQAYKDGNNFNGFTISLSFFIF